MEIIASYPNIEKPVIALKFKDSSKENMIENIKKVLKILKDLQ
ncbi:MAG: hypothetical protein RR645_02455 [Clostridium sp.]